MVPAVDSVQLVQITPITMVFVGDISIVNGTFGGHHLVHFFKERPSSRLALVNNTTGLSH